MICTELCLVYDIAIHVALKVIAFRLRQNGHCFAGIIFKLFFFFIWKLLDVLIKISHKCVGKGPNNHMPALVEIMACCWAFNKPLSQPMMAYFTGVYCIHASLGLKGLWLLNFYSELVVFRFLQKCVCVSIIIKRTLCPYTVWCRYNAVSSLKNPHKRDPIARPLRRGMGCLLWIEPLIYILSQSVQWWVQYHLVYHHAITAPYNGTL